MRMDPNLNYWTVTDVAECLNVSRAIRAKLWECHDDKMTPQMETPDLIQTGNDMEKHWHKFSEQEQEEINAAILQ